MRFATFNLYQYLAPPEFWYERSSNNTYSAQAWKAKRQWVLSQLDELDADVVGFQEVFSGLDLEKLLKKAGYPHFFILPGETCDPDDEQIRIAPKVAIASRYPFKSVSGLEADPAGMTQLGTASDFSFSRVPLTAVIKLPDLGSVRVVVAHLKSKRSGASAASYPKRTPWKNRVAMSMQQQSLGKIVSLGQRGAEATLIYRHVVDQLLAKPDIPCIVMGDLNDSAESIVFESLVMQGSVKFIGENSKDLWPAGVDEKIQSYRLNDAFRQAPDYKTRVRPHTHVHAGSPNTLDYVLLSNHFNRDNAQHSATVMAYQVLNEHLDQDDVSLGAQSDHAPVVVTISAPTQPDAVQPIESDAIVSKSAVGARRFSREEFVTHAGGVYESRVSWRKWGGRDKYQNYWAFYFDADYGWVKSVYGRVPVSELYQRQRYSIEHIIPRSFLRQYLNSKKVPNAVRYGASVNPLNFAASERGLNSSRSSFPFDMDGDEVLRPFRIDLNPDAYGTTGLDADNEWVIPSISRGDIARSILYMVMTYGIDELYNRHLETLVHWAKVDPATPWELAFNAWVHGRFGIRNPLIDEPTVANQYLDDVELLRSVLVPASAV